MRVNTKDELTYFELKYLLNQLGKDQGYKTAKEWDRFLHSYCSSILDDPEEYDPRFKRSLNYALND